MKTIIPIILTLFICSCGRNSTNETSNAGSIKVIDLLSEPESEITGISDIATDLDYIPLQTTANSLVGSITKIVTRDNKIYIKNSFDEILCFDRGGSFLIKLDKEGRGPEEYTLIADFDVSSDNKTLLILSSGKILIFKDTATEFLFAKSINLKRPFPSKISMIPGTTNILLSIDPFMGTEQSLSIMINIDGDTLYYKPNHYRYENKTTQYRMINESLQFEFVNETCFKEEFSDTVFFVDRESHEFQPRLIFDSHGKGFLPRVRYDKEYARSHAAENYWVYLIMDTSRYIIYTYEHNMTRNKMVYDKSANRKFKLAQKNLGEDFNNTMEDDIYGGPVFDPSFCSENKLYSSVEALTLKKYVAGEEFAKAKVQNPVKKKNLNKLADSLDETDNPVLIVMTPKN